MSGEFNKLQDGVEKSAGDMIGRACRMQIDGTILGVSITSGDTAVTVIDDNGGQWTTTIKNIKLLG